MGTVDLLGVIALTVAVFGVWGAFTANGSLRQAGRLALFSGLLIFELASVFRVLVLPGDLASIIIVFLTVLVAVMIAGWFTRRFYLDFDPRDSYHEDTDLISR